MEQQKQYKYMPKENVIVKTKLPNIGKVIMVASGKGGVGK